LVALTRMSVADHEEKYLVMGTLSDSRTTARNVQSGTEPERPSLWGEATKMGGR